MSKFIKLTVLNGTTVYFRASDITMVMNAIDPVSRVSSTCLTVGPPQPRADGEFLRPNNFLVRESISIVRQLLDGAA